MQPLRKIHRYVAAPKHNEHEKTGLMCREQPELAGRAGAGHLRLGVGVRGVPGARRLRGRRHGRGYGSQQVRAQVLYLFIFELSLTVFWGYSFIYLVLRGHACGSVFVVYGSGMLF
jgi:hypothetical protein